MQQRSGLIQNKMPRQKTVLESSQKTNQKTHTTVREDFLKIASFLINKYAVNPINDR